jgi:hypothetical protein
VLRTDIVAGHAARELTGDGPTGYVVLRVNEGSGDVNRGRSLRMLIKQQHYLCRPPTIAEREALEKGLEVLGIRHGRGGRAAMLSFIAQSARRRPASIVG